MHILIVALHRPTKPTGVCRHAVNLAQCLVDLVQVTKVTLVIGVWQGIYFKNCFNLCSEKINIVEIDIKNSSLSRNYWYLFGLPKLAAKLCPNIIHLSFPIPFIRSLFSCPVVSTIHDLYPYECPENFGFPQVLFNRLFLKQCINNSHGLACVSQVTLEGLNFHFRYLHKLHKKAVIYNYVDFSDIYPKIPENLVLEKKTSFILSVAQHRKNKNLNLVIEAYSLLLKSSEIQPYTKLIIVGSQGPETESLQQQICNLSLSQQVIIFSGLEDSQLRWLYQNCELFIIASSTEGFCLPLAEALYLNCKIVCSDIPIFREIGNEQCQYFNLGKNPIQNIYEAIAKTLPLPKPTKNISQDRFNKLHIADKYLKLYLDLK